LLSSRDLGQRKEQKKNTDAVTKDSHAFSSKRTIVRCWRKERTMNFGYDTRLGSGQSAGRWLRQSRVP
jgi:hypothetical protein